MMVSWDAHRRQIESILTAWGVSLRDAAQVADVLAWADLRGIESHGIAMLIVYDGWRSQGRLNLRGRPRVERATPVSALVDGDGGFGHVVGIFAMTIAIEKARANGMAAIAVRNSSHYGALGYFVEQAADVGLVAVTTSTTAGVRVAPTGGMEVKLGTDPLAFGAPGEPDKPFLLDMATTTTAFGKIRNKAREGLPVPPGWVLTAEGLPSTDPLDAVERGGFMTSLGGTEECGNYKGYGLSVMVNILASCLSGATLVTDPMHGRKPQSLDLGHFFLVLDPDMFRQKGAFARDVAGLCQALRATKPRLRDRPVLVAGDPERLMAGSRSDTGIAIPRVTRRKLQEIAAAAGAEWLLDDPADSD